MILDPHLLLLLIACLFILLFGGLSAVRREGLSVQFALESLGLTALLVGGSWLTGIRISPVMFLVLLYVITMRSRLLVDVANLTARRGRYDLAFRIYQLGLAWWPDASSRLILLTNRGAAELHTGQLDVAISTLEVVLAEEQRPRLGFKYQAASHYNLGLAFDKKGEGAKAVAQFNEAIDLLPGSPYARAAEAALKRRRSKTARD